MRAYVPHSSSTLHTHTHTPCNTLEYIGYSHYARVSIARPRAVIQECKCAHSSGELHRPIYITVGLFAKPAARQRERILATCWGFPTRAGKLFKKDFSAGAERKEEVMTSVFSGSRIRLKFWDMFLDVEM